MADDAPLKEPCCRPVRANIAQGLAFARPGELPDGEDAFCRIDRDFDERERQAHKGNATLSLGTPGGILVPSNIAGRTRLSGMLDRPGESVSLNVRSRP